MWIGFAILGVGLIAAGIAVARHGKTEGIYVGIVEKDLALGTGVLGLHVRAYVDERLARELTGQSRLTGRMMIRETNASVPLMFVRAPWSTSPTPEWEEEAEVPVRPVIFRFDPAPGLAVHPGQLVDVYIGQR
ncbi:MAG: putative rane protein [Acidobacteria bacterium]|nr:putative rane protein [Acidobacteriota bacterium]